MTETQQATETVLDLFDALRSRDTDRAMSLLDNRIVWHNVGLPEVRGRANAGKFVAMLARPAFGFDVIVHNIAADGNVVLTERTDVLIWRRLRIEFWVCGTFEMRDGRIAVWRDYFDTVDFLKGVVRGIFRVVVGR
ncbi:limonene-1,2-epoxide hydrolase family protein [Rhodococcus cerastii]|uniref:Limonene-1,2-epoxide hydrolase family protein n=1 Tax=Rhodococcus cerastii TaxID=908616 RepID=A0ABU4D200_9NOCA|nr:limonene-1,2-epoxide hydrolase family protein [Rhodococcus cerastii]MDV6303753.1 limonene-1,2-epoxide hydrolase family protein [Rhodococcus cerastii]